MCLDIVCLELSTVCADGAKESAVEMWSSVLVNLESLLELDSDCEHCCSISSLPIVTCSKTNANKKAVLLVYQILLNCSFLF